MPAVRRAIPCKGLLARMTTITDAYLAGFFDGEGCIGIYKNGKRSHHLRLQLVQNESRVVTAMFSELQLRFGGNFRGHFSPNGRSKYNLQLNGDKAVAFLEVLRPYLVLKRPQAELAIAWHNSRPAIRRDASGRIQSQSDAQHAIDERVAELLRLLKRRDSSAVLAGRPDLIQTAEQFGADCVLGASLETCHALDILP